MEKSDTDRDSSATSTHGVATGSNIPQENTTTLQDSAQPSSSPARTPGLKLFDILLYPLLTNAGVFTMSVAATYLTMRGGDKHPNGQLKFGKIGEWFSNRGERLKSLFTRLGMTESQADTSRMVAFSFIDGSVMAPVVKAFEDKREHIGKAIDVQLGTCPDDHSVYEAEPKQSWGSVLGGRLATVSLVVPTAVMLERFGLNDKLFTKPGFALGQKLAQSPALAKHATRFDIPMLGKIGLFEAFYTSVCTAGIYFSSRFLARHTQRPKATSMPDSSSEQSVAMDTTAYGEDSNTSRSSNYAAKHKPKNTFSAAGNFSQRLSLEAGSSAGRVY